MRGANAAVVGILAAALYSPVWISAILGQDDFAPGARRLPHTGCLERSAVGCGPRNGAAGIGMRVV